MIHLITAGHDFAYELSDIIKMFYGREEIKHDQEDALEETLAGYLNCNELCLVSTQITYDGRLYCISKAYHKEQLCSHEESMLLSEASEVRQIKKLVKKSMYKLLSKLENKSFPWGILTGIRPIKIVHELMDKGIAKEDIQRELLNSYLISPERAALALQVADVERKYIHPIKPDNASIYVGIPFCPTRCHYCSFTSNSIKSCGSYVEPYLEKLMLEIENTAQFLKARNIKAQSIYIGGGTPTSINHKQLERLVACINRSFGGQYEEFTCEAGRPDTIDRDKLTVLKEGGVTRLSINPQTMNDETLTAIGRSHNVRQIIESFWLAREIGFDNINMDIILGLPGEEMKQLEHTLQQIEKLNPESITVHTMALKRASVLHEANNNELLKNDIADAMMKRCMIYMAEHQLEPYYLYRQKHMLKNLENIGFCKKGYECIYNIQIIEEKQTNVAFGADAVTKIIIPEENRLERQHNIKELRLYIEQVDEMIRKKLELLSQIW